MPAGHRTLTLVAALTAILAAAGPVAARQPISPGQHFVGLVNNTRRGAVVSTVCPGPAQPGSEGPVAGSQTMSVQRTSRGGGYTGPFDHVYAWFVPASTGPRPVMLQFTAYGMSQAIPTSIEVPCSGTGRVEFSSCPYLAPCAAGWVPEIVRVTFVDIAV